MTNSHSFLAEHLGLPRRAAGDRTDPRQRRGVARAGFAVVLLAAAFAGSGCAPSTTRLAIESFRDGATGSRVQESFDEAYFASDEHGRWEIVFRARRPSAVETGGELVEVVHVNVVWRAIPGMTAVEQSQTNATLCYALMDVDRAISYEGAGMVTFALDRTGNEMTGQIESGALNAGRVTGDAPDVLGKSLVSGTFTAKRDLARVAEMRTELRRKLGQPIKYKPRPNTDEVR